MVEILRSDLTVANEGFNADSTDHGRSDVLVALVAVCDFIERFEEMKRYRLSDPLRALALALTELDPSGNLWRRRAERDSVRWRGQ
jgi:hypothetical protein